MRREEQGRHWLGGPAGAWGKDPLWGLRLRPLPEKGDSQGHSVSVSPKAVQRGVAHTAPRVSPRHEGEPTAPR